MSQPEPKGTERASCPLRSTYRGEHHGEDNWEEEIRSHFGASFVVLGVGNRIRGDDAAGPLVAEGLAERGLEGAFDCGGVPENYVTKVERLDPTDILFVDAVDFGAQAGRIGFFGGERFDAQSFSTHSAGLSPLMDYLSQSCRARCWVLSIQPERLGYSTELSEPVRKAVEEIVSSNVWFP